MNDKAGRYIGKGIAWLGFWVMIGLVNYGEGFGIKQNVNALIKTVSTASEAKAVSPR